MGANDRLAELQSELVKRGVRDAKFCFSLDMAAKPSSDVAYEVSGLLEAYLAERYVVVEKIGDAPVK